MPSGIYVAMGLMSAGFLTVLTFAFSSKMGLSFGAIFFFLAVCFAIPRPVPAPGSRTSALRLQDFLKWVIDTNTGRMTAGSATVLVLALPFLILCFEIAVATIAALI